MAQPRSFRCSWLLLLFLFPWPGSPAQGKEAPSATPPPAPPVTTRSDAVGKLVNGWFAEGSAAGNRGDRYDNRDNGHSRLNLTVFPQLQSVTYTPEELSQRRNQGPAAALLPFPAIGNASLSAAVNQGGSLARIIYLTPNGLRLLQTSYLSNNLYVYPEHQDHDPLHGDLYPLNTPYLLISQGSSFSDQPFLEALTLTLASFQPEVKEELIRSRLLVPTLQFILRSSLKPVRSREDYLSGLTHPSVFPPEWLDVERMVHMAHQMIRATIPPVVRLAPRAESPAPRLGIEFFEPPQLASEVLANEISVIGRVFRSTAPERVLRVSAAGSADLLGRPLRVTWRLLRGDPALVTLNPSPSGHETEIRVRYHPQPFAVPGQPAIRSSRIDIGAFADNGISLSAPAFVCIYLLPSEQRVFDEKGRLLQIDYQAPLRHHELPPANSFRWASLLESVWNSRASWAGHFLTRTLSDAERRSLMSLSGNLEPLLASKRKWEGQLQSQQETLARHRTLVQNLQSSAKGDPSLLAEAERQRKDLQMLESASQHLASVTQNNIAALERQWEQQLRARQVDQQTFLDVLTNLVDRLIDSPDLFLGNQAMLEERAKTSPKPGALARLQQVRQRLLDRRVLLSDPEAPDLIVSSAPLLDPKNKFYLQALNRTLLADVLLPELLDYQFADELADPRLTIPKPWRDEFVYDRQTGELRGWLRMQKGRVSEFDAQGRLMTPQGPISATYQINPQSRLLEIQ